MSFLYEQLPLELQLRDHTTFDNWCAGDNAALVAQIKSQLRGGERYLYIHGAPGSGRSHLLQAACHDAGGLQLPAVYLPLAELRDYAPETLFEGLESLSLVCLDDLHCAVGDARWERALFSLFNALAEHDVRLLVSADVAVRELPVELRDLRSRLSWGVVYRIAALSDGQRRQAIRERATGRGLELSDELLNFIFDRCQRDMDSLLDTLDRLDRASLREKRRLTIPFVKTTMGW